MVSILNGVIWMYALIGIAYVICYIFMPKNI